MTSINYFYSFLFIGFFYLWGCTPVINKDTILESLREDVYYLASDSLEGREVGSEGEKKAARYIAGRFEEIGLEPKGEEDYFQDFSFSPRINPHSIKRDTGNVKIYGRNVVGYIDNPSDTIVIIGAHYDHLGYGGKGSLSDERSIHNGADDNASGVAMLLSIAKLLKNRSLSYDYLFIAFSGEEKGLYGSSYFVKNPTVELSRSNYMINFDMVGRLDEENSLAINGVGTSPSWEENIAGINMDSLNILLKESGTGFSDHTSFYLKNIPVLHFFTGTHEDYHKPSDDADKLNYEGMYLISTFVDSMITTVDGDPVLTFTKTSEEMRKTPRLKVTLGVVPDYLFDGKGMRIDGVREGRPAHRAGLKSGDVIIGLDEEDVIEIKSYMNILSGFEKGDSTTVTVKRGNETIRLSVVF